MKVGAPLPFRTRVSILPGPRRGERVLVKVADGTQCGYVQSAKILSGQPLKVSDIDADEQVRVSIFGVVRNNWTIKAMLRSNPKHDTKTDGAQLVDAPGAEGRPFRGSRVFNLFNVFKVEKKGSDPDDWWYFVGGKKVADDKMLSGWVRGGNLFLWGSGMAIYPTADKRAPFDIYTDVRDAQVACQGGPHRHPSTTSSPRWTGMSSNFPSSIRSTRMRNNRSQSRHTAPCLRDRLHRRCLCPEGRPLRTHGADARGD